jgi:aldose 1-epimerase
VKIVINSFYLQTMGRVTWLYFFVLLAFLLAINVNGSEAKEEEVGVYELKRGNFALNLTNYGATVLSVILPDKNGL